MAQNKLNLLELNDFPWNALMDAARAAEFAADMLRLTQDAAPLVYAKLKEPKE